MEENKNIPETEAAEEAATNPEITEETAQEPAEQTAEPDPVAEIQEKLSQEQDKYMRLAAEYDNFRKRTQKEHDALFLNAKADTIGKFLPVFDNLQRAMAQETADEAYKKGVELTMNGLQTILDAMGVEAYGQVGDPFDPNYHNAIMQREDENFGESTICEVYQTGYKIGEKVIRHAMVIVAN